MEVRACGDASGILDEDGRRVALPRDVRRDSIAFGLARLRESCRGEGVCALGREVVADGRAVASGGFHGTFEGTERQYPWGSDAPSSTFGNFDFSHWNPTPVNAFPEGRSAFGVHDMLGNGWEWTSSVFAPFAGFEPFPFYRGYSADFFDGKHFVMKGGSPRTAACMLRPTFRNWFQAHYQYVYAGFRCVKY